MSQPPSPTAADVIFINKNVTQNLKVFQWLSTESSPRTIWGMTPWSLFSYQPHLPLLSHALMLAWRGDWPLPEDSAFIIATAKQLEGQPSRSPVQTYTLPLPA